MDAQLINKLQIIDKLTTIAQTTHWSLTKILDDVCNRIPQEFSTIQDGQLLEELKRYTDKKEK